MRPARLSWRCPCPKCVAQAAAAAREQAALAAAVQIGRRP